MSYHHVNKSFDIDGLVYIEDVLVEMEVETEQNELEPYSWGQGRGSETVISSIKMTGFQIGGLTLTYDQAQKMFGPETIDRLHEFVTLDDLTLYP